MKTPWSVVFCAVLSATVVTGDDRILIPGPDGPYAVVMTSEELIDHGRPDPWNASEPYRRIMVSRLTPVPQDGCVRKCRTPYFPGVLAPLEDEIFTAYFSGLGWPHGLLARLDVQLCCEARPAPSTEKVTSFPFLLAGSGHNTTRFYLSVTAAYMASYGYEVVLMDHPYETDVVEFPDGRVIFGGHVNNSDPASIVYALDARLHDAQLVLDTYKPDADTGSIGYFGQSFGGAAAAHMMLNDTRVRAGANLDGRMFGPALAAGLGRPGISQSFLIWGSTRHNSSNTSEPSWGQFLQTMEQYHSDEWVRELSLFESVHGTFGDFSLIGDVAGLRDEQHGELKAAMFGDLLGSRVMTIVITYLRSFFRFTLRGEDEGVLAGPSAEWPEVLFLN
jgi:hypothetical protein